MWRPSEKDGGSKILEYIVEIKENSKKVWKTVGTTSREITTLFVENLIKDQGYHFRITARNKVGSSEPLATDEKIIAGSRISKFFFYKYFPCYDQFVPTPAPPSPPQNLKITDVTSKSVTIEWETPASNGGTEITGYIIEKFLAKSSQWSKIVTLDSYCLTYCIDNLKEKTELIFRVVAENSVGMSAPVTSNSVHLKSHASELPIILIIILYIKPSKSFAAVPSAPTGPLEIRLVGPNTNVVEWGIPESNGGSPLEGYHIAIRDMKKTMWIEVGRVKADMQKFNIRDLQEDHEYLIRILARNEIGLSEPLESDDPYKVLRGTGE